MYYFFCSYHLAFTTKAVNSLLYVDLSLIFYSLDKEELQTDQVIDRLNHQRLAINSAKPTIPNILTGHRSQTEHRPPPNFHPAPTLVTALQEAHRQLHRQGPLTVTYNRQELEIVPHKDIHLKAPEPHTFTKVQHWFDLMAHLEAQDRDP